MRPIDADALREEWLWNGENENIYDTNDFLNSLDAAPTLDVEPVRHGRWEDRQNPQWKAYDIRHCSACGWSIAKNNLRKKDLNWRFCPNCGAKMDGGDGDGSQSND